MAVAPVQVRIGWGAEGLALLDDRWDDLVARQMLPNPLLSVSWLRALAAWSDGMPLVAVAEAGSTLAAGAALELRRGASRVGPVVGTWLGPFEQLVSPDLLADPAHPHAAAALLTAILEHVHLLRLERTPLGGVAGRAIAAVVPWHRSHETGTRWVAPCPLPTVDRIRRRLASEVAKAERAGSTVTVRVASAPEDVEASLVRLFRLHRDRWRNRPGEEPRFATTRAHRRWNAFALGELAAVGRVRLAEVIEDDRLVGADLGIVHGRGAVAHTTAIRPTHALQHPGHLATLACIEALTAAGATAVDLGVGGGGPGTAKGRFAPRGEPVGVLLAARSAALQRELAIGGGLRAAVGWLRMRAGR